MSDAASADEGGAAAAADNPDHAADASADSPAVTYSRKDLTVPKGARTWWWGGVIGLLPGFKQLQAAGDPDAWCLICKKALKYAGKTGNIDGHVKLLHKRLQTKAGSASILSYCKQTDSFLYKFVKWLVRTIQPLSIGETEEFLDMIRCASPNAKVPSRRKVCKVLDQLDEIARIHIKQNMLQQFVAITTDAWSSNSNQAFLSLTAHYIDEEFALWMLPLECSPFDGSHTGKRTLEKTNAMLSSNNISEEYVSSLVADNARNQAWAGNAAAYDYDPCGPHTLQLTAKKLLNDPVMAAVLRKCRKIVGAFRHSGLKCEELRAEQVRCELKLMRMVQDVSTRWSSTYMSIKVLHINKVPVDVVCVRHAAPASATRATKKAKTSSAAPLTEAVSYDSSSTTAAVTAPGVAPTTAARAVTRLSSGALAALPSGTLADKEDSESDCSSSDDGSVDCDEPVPLSTGDSDVEVLDAASSGSSSSDDSDSGNSGASDFDQPARNSGRSRGGRGGAGRGGNSSSTGMSKGKSKAKARPTISAAISTTAQPVKRASKATSKRKRDKYMPKLSEEEWSMVQSALLVLGPIYDAQKELEGDYVTRSWLPLHVQRIRDRLQELAVEEELAVADAAELLLADLDERWPAQWSRATSLAVVLDPRTKFMTCFNATHRARVWLMLSKQMLDVYKLQHPEHTAAVTDADAAGAGCVSTATPANTSFYGMNLAVDPDADQNETYDDTVTDAQALLLGRIQSEVSLYKKEPPIDTTANPLDWWKAKHIAYPLMAVVARKWLAVPASSAASERLFSTAGLTVTKLRNRLGADRVSTLVFLKAAWPALEAQGILYGSNSTGFDIKRTLKESRKLARVRTRAAATTAVAAAAV